MDILEKSIQQFDSKVKYVSSDWAYFSYNQNLSDSGWKIHISSQMKDAVSIFTIVASFLRKIECSFKVAKDIESLKKINSPRETSPIANKFMAIYPANNKQAREIILALHEKLARYFSPRILSDFQCGKHSPLHYRFGSFKKIQKYDENNHKIIYLLKNEEGDWVEDIRKNFPVIPDWKEDLFTPEEKQEFFGEIGKIPENHLINNYRFEIILKKCNRGNVYRAQKKDTGEKVIVKQVRPFVGNDVEGKHFAIAEIKNEANMLKTLGSQLYTANFIDEFEVDGDYFVIQSFIEGYSYFDLIGKDRLTYRTKLKLIDNLISIVNSIHSLGYKIVDLSPTNFIYREDGSIFLIDLENVSPIKDVRRYIKTPFMVNPDNDLSASSINQDYFAVAMTSFAILVGRTLVFSSGDDRYDISCIDKIKQALQIAKNMEYISESVYYWLIYLLNLSESKEPTHIIKKINEIEFSNIDMSEVNFNVSCYDFKKESEKIAHFILSQNMDCTGRILPSNEFGEFVDPISFQHGLSGYIIFVMQCLSAPELNLVKHWVQQIEIIRDSKSYLYQKSLYFGTSGFLWALILLFEKTGDIFYKNKATSLVNEILLDYDNIGKQDFVLGKAGVLLSLMRYYELEKTVYLEEFIHTAISNLEEEISKDFSQHNSLFDYSFAHGKAGIIYVFNEYKILFDNKKFDSTISIFTEEVAKILSQEILKNKNSYNNLELSWCDGLSGFVLYLCLVEPLKYSKLISDARVLILDHHLSMETCYCHGISSLLQTYAYVFGDNDKNNIVQLLLTKSFRKYDELLVFQSENRNYDYFDFGIGTLGIYWALLGFQFPFELKKEAIQ